LGCNPIHLPPHDLENEFSLPFLLAFTWISMLVLSFIELLANHHHMIAPPGYQLLYLYQQHFVSFVDELVNNLYSNENNLTGPYIEIHYRTAFILTKELPCLPHNEDNSSDLLIPATFHHHNNIVSWIENLFP
jgi:hypothetical protein